METITLFQNLFVSIEVVYPSLYWKHSCRTFYASFKSHGFKSSQFRKTGRGQRIVFAAESKKRDNNTVSKFIQIISSNKPQLVLEA
jgi:hypothetical protein